MIATDNPILLSFDSSWFATAAFYLRRNIPTDDGETMASKADVLHRLGSMAACEGFGIGPMKQQRLLDGKLTNYFDFERLILCMELCGHQRGDSRLRSVLSVAGRLIGLSEN